MSLQTLKLIVVGIALGLAVGVGFYTFVYAKGYSYMSNNPATCANCHIMQEQYDGWMKSSHKTVATCNDCHTPHSFPANYWVKATNGFWHSYYFTLGGFPEPIQIRGNNLQVAEASCRHCHQQMVESITVSHRKEDIEGVSCISCHRDVGHPH